MDKTSATALVKLPEIERDLDAIRLRLLMVRATLPPGRLEINPLDEEDTPDTPTYMRAIIECLLTDSIEPALGSLRELTTLVEGR
jgi:hypothetical protein